MEMDEAIKRAMWAALALDRESQAISEADSLKQSLEELLALPFEQRVETILCSRDQYDSPKLASVLLERSRSCAGSDPESSFELAALADLVARRARSNAAWRPFAIDLLALAIALRGNARRIRGKYGEAQRLFERALRILDRGSGDPVAFGDIRALEGSLLLDLYRHADAEAAVRQAIEAFQECGEKHRLGRALMQLSIIQEDAGDPEKAIESLRTALEHLDLNQEPRLGVQAYCNLAAFVTEAGDPLQAREILAAHPLPADIDERTRLKRGWIESRIQTALGNHEAAAETLSRLRGEFQRLGDTNSAAMVSLDLALAFARQGLISQERQVAAETLLLLQEEAPPQEIWAAQVLLKQAADAEVANSARLASGH